MGRTRVPEFRWRQVGKDKMLRRITRAPKHLPKSWLNVCSEPRIKRAVLAHSLARMLGGGN
eukprot:1502153-Rhodomonas_salina.2